MAAEALPGLSPGQRALKRGLDLVVAVPLAILSLPVVLPAVLLATLDTGQAGLFVQRRVGRHGRLVPVAKVRTMRAPRPGESRTTVTAGNDPRITRLGAFWRRSKIDELPQLWNVVCGQMSLVGPRPDVPGFADRLQGRDRALLQLRPGITGPATLRYRDEEALLAAVEDPEAYNREVIWPDKVRINLAYLENWSLGEDLRLLWQTLVGTG